MSDALPKPVADLGDSIVDGILDAIDLEEPELRDRLLSAIKRGDYFAQRFPDREVVTFPRQRIEYTIPFVRVPPSASDRLN